MDNNTTYHYWRVIAKLAGYTIPEDLPRPNYIGKKECPPNLNGLTIGQLIELSGSKGEDTDYRICEIVLGYDTATTNDCRAIEVVPFLSWIGRQVKAINKLFENVSHKPSAKETKAGIERLQFGLFGLLDWFAKRMGITNHDEVLGVPWLRIYKCLDMDNQTNEYERRLNDISLQEAKRRNK